MESSERTNSNSESPHQKWADILGMTVAVVTLTLPLWAIAYYSPFSSNAEALPQEIYQPFQREK